MVEKINAQLSSALKWDGVYKKWTPWDGRSHYKYVTFYHSVSTSFCWKVLPSNLLTTWWFIVRRWSLFQALLFMREVTVPFLWQQVQGSLLPQNIFLLKIIGSVITMESVFLFKMLNLRIRRQIFNQSLTRLIVCKY